jgi:hypothetical protein
MSLNKASRWTENVTRDIAGGKYNGMATYLKTGVSPLGGTPVDDEVVAELPDVVTDDYLKAMFKELYPSYDPDSKPNGLPSDHPPIMATIKFGGAVHSERETTVNPLAMGGVDNTDGNGTAGFGGRGKRRTRRRTTRRKSRRIKRKTNRRKSKRR